MKFMLLTAAVLLAPAALYAQVKTPATTAKPHTHTMAPTTKAPATKAPAVKAPATTIAAAVTAEPEVMAPIPLAPVTPAADPNALKIRAEYNPIGHILSVKCDAAGPTRIEINDQDGRPVLTKNVIAGTTAVPFKVALLPAGPYVVRCTAGDKKGTRLVQLGH